MKYGVGGAVCTGLDLYFFKTYAVWTYLPNLCCCTISDSKDLQPLVETTARLCLELLCAKQMGKKNKGTGKGIGAAASVTSGGTARFINNFPRFYRF